MKTARKTPVTATSERIRIMAAARTPIAVPDTVPLNDDELPFFSSVVNEFAKADWTPHQLEVAAMLAMSMAAAVRELRLLNEEGATIDGAMGGYVTNPRKQVVQMHQNAVVAYRRSLALHAAAQGRKETVGKTKMLAKQFEADSPFDDDLIARPMAN